MTRTRFKIALGMSWVLASVPVHAQAPSTDCKSFVLNAYQRVQERYTLAAKRKQGIANFAMRIDTYHRLPGQKGLTKSTQQVKTVMQGDRLFYTDGATELYQSPGQLVAISTGERLVYVSNATYSAQQQIVPNIELLRDGIIRESTISSCEPITQNGKAFRRVRLVPKPAFREQFNAEFLELLIDARATEVAQYRIIYGPASKVASVQYTVVPADGAKAGHTAGVALPFSYVLDAHNALLPKFAGYRLVDQRKR